MERALDDAGQHGGRYAVAGYVRDQQRGPSERSAGVIVQVAAQPGARRVAAADRDAVDDRFAIRQQTLLKGPRFGNLGFESLQVLSMLLAAPAELETAFDERSQHLAIERLLNE